MGKFRNNSRATIAETVLAINLPVPDFGGLYIGDTNEHTVTSPQEFCGYLAATDSVIDIAGANLDGTLTSISVKAGVFLPFIGNRIKLASGNGVGYYADNR